MNANSKVFLALGLCFFILAWKDQYIYPLANPQSRLFGRVLWWLEEIFGGNASWVFLVILGFVMMYIAYLETRRR